jgi:hypothetical protein
LFLVFLLVAPVLVALVAGKLSSLTINRDKDQERERRGFEVKSTTGGEPVMNKKEDDHG